jgi:hypothetical protein
LQGLKKNLFDRTSRKLPAVVASSTQAMQDADEKTLSIPR